MSKMTGSVIDPWLKLRFVFGRFDRVLRHATVTGLLLGESDQRILEEARLVFAALAEASQGIKLLTTHQRAPQLLEDEYATVASLALPDLVRAEPLFCEPANVRQLVLIISDWLEKGRIPVDQAENLTILASDLYRLAEERTSVPMDRVVVTRDPDVPPWKDI